MNKQHRFHKILAKIAQFKIYYTCITKAENLVKIIKNIFALSYHGNKNLAHVTLKNTVKNGKFRNSSFFLFRPSAALG